MNINRKSIRPSVELRTLTKGDVFYLVGEGGELLIMGEGLKDTCNTTSLVDGSVLITHYSSKVVKVEGEFVC